MTKHIFTSAVFAGFAAGLIAALLHFAFVQKYILLGEDYETGALTHFTSGSSADDAQHSDGAQVTDKHAHADGHDHDDTSAEPSPLQRNALSVLFITLVYTAYSLLLVAGFAIAHSFGRQISANTGLLWGIAGFAAFQMAPALGLPPELPGTIAAELGLRQLWWWSTVAATGAGLAVIAYGRKPWSALLGLGIMALPHIIGAPQPDAFFGVAPPEVSAAFSARVLGTGLTVWAVLGWLAGHFWSKETPA